MACVKVLGFEQVWLLEKVPKSLCTHLLLMIKSSRQAPNGSSKRSGSLILSGEESEGWRGHLFTCLRSVFDLRLVTWSQRQRWATLRGPWTPGLSVTTGAGRPCRGAHLMLKGAINRTTYCRSLGSLSFGIFDGSKSGG